MISSDDMFCEGTGHLYADSIPEKVLEAFLFAKIGAFVIVHRANAVINDCHYWHSEMALFRLMVIAQVSESFDTVDGACVTSS